MKKLYTVTPDILNAAGEVSTQVKRLLQQLGVSQKAVRRFSVALYEGEINMAVHAGGGTAEIDISSKQISAVLKDQGPGIADVDLAMQEGFSTANEYIRELGFGAGMGLPNMKRYTDIFTLESSPDTGTTVSFTVFLNGDAP
jgi:anti-sigma regulatory factor (Ser/Thr protein kinase)